MSQIVLTADRSLMSEYGGGIFLGFAACAPTLLDEWLYKKILCPSVPKENGIAKRAPCGLRKMEAALLEQGFDVKVAHPEHLDKVIGPDTKVVGITANDPLGLGPASSTFSSIIGRETYSALFFRKLIMDPALRSSGAKVIVGGPGAWQVADEKIAVKMGIDCVVVGEGEITGVEMFRRAVEGKDVPRVVHGEVVPLEKIPNIRNPTVCGLVEIARGCGKGCHFCVPTLKQLRCRPIEKITEEIKINLAGGAEGALLHAEDTLRYGADGLVPNEERVIRLFSEALKLTPHVWISHFAFSSVMANPGLIERITEMIASADEDLSYISGQVGLETGSPRIVEKHMRGKALPFKPEEWPEVVVEAHKVLADNRWVPCCTLIMGLPGETPEDTAKTIELLDRIDDYMSLVVPLFMVPLGGLGNEKFFLAKDMRPDHWQLMAACIRHDFRWVDKLAEDYLGGRGLKGIIFKDGIIRVLKRALKPYLRLMDEGINPFKGNGAAKSPATVQSLQNYS
ncbi:MAG: radical SAM protein [Candidatus Hadarchaeales archaeon]